MNVDRRFVHALSEFLAVHTDQSPRSFGHLIESFFNASRRLGGLDQPAKSSIQARLAGEMESFDNVPTFLQNYLLTHLAHNEWPPQAVFVASRYLARQPGDRFVDWTRRQRFVADLKDEPIRGTELGLRQMLYSQGAGPVFRWRGIPCFKSIYDIAIYAMLIEELRPKTIVELGSGAGGSSLLFADLCASMNLGTKIISIDKIAAKISDPRIEFVRSDCAEWLGAAVKSKDVIRRPCLLIEDFHGDLAGVFQEIDAIMEFDDYLIVEDSFPKQDRIAEVIASRPYLIDAKYTDFFGINCTSAINSIFVKRGELSLSAPRHRHDRDQRQREDREWREKNRRQT